MAATIRTSGGGVDIARLKFNSLSLTRRFGLALTLMLAAPAHAQDGPDAGTDDEEADIEKIVVTGSRIARRDFEANSPIVSVGEELFDNGSDNSIENQLNKLPQFAPTNDVPFDSDDIQATSTSTPGTASVALRGLGPNRSLTLIDGRRGTPANALGVVDTNTIPGGMVERVEIISGGASAVYGADAVAGVVNFVLKKDFEGLQVDAQTSLTDAGDGEETSLDLLMGANFADGRGNVMFSGGYYRRNSAYNRNRDWIVRDWQNPDIAGGFWPPSNVVMYQPERGTYGYPSQEAVDAAYSNLPPGTIPYTSTQFFAQTADPLDAVLHGGWGRNAGQTAVAAGQYPDEIDGTEVFIGDDGKLYRNNVDGLTSLPLERWTMFGRGNYDFDNGLRAFSQGYFTRSNSSTLQSPATALNNWGVMIPHGNGIYAGNAAAGIPSSLNEDGTTNAAYLAGGRFGLDCPDMGGCTNSQVFPTPAALTTMLDSRPDPNQPFVIGQELGWLGYREVEVDNFTYQLLAGLGGSIPVQDWQWEIYASQGQTRVNTYTTGIASLERLRAVRSAPNYGVGFQTVGNEELGNFGGAFASCTSGINPFSSGEISEDCKDAVRGNLQSVSDITQRILEGSITGTLFAMPAGDVSFALGGDYRSLDFNFRNDTLTSQGSSFLDQAVGIYPSGNTSGKIDVVEYFGELLIPIVQDLPGVQGFDLELGYRYSDFNTTGGDATYKILADWRVNDFVRVRGGYNRAVRSPNIAELFQAPSVTFTSAGSDPCEYESTLSYSASPTANTTNAADVEDLCRTLMNGGGDTFYSAGLGNDGSSNVFGFKSVVGNSGLSPETADTYTLGLVLNSPFDSPWLADTRLSIDYYSIRIEQAIGEQTPAFVRQQCFDVTRNPGLDPNNPFCRAITRDSGNGVPLLIDVTYTNDVAIETAGIDIQLNWTLDFQEAGLGLPGIFNLNVLGNLLEQLDVVSSPGASAIDYVGTLGPDGEAQINGGNGYRYRLFTTMNYALGPATVGLQWRHLPAADSVQKASNPDTPFYGVDAYDLFNLNGTYAITSDIVLRMGVDNLFDTDPPRSEYDTRGVGENGVLEDTFEGGRAIGGFYDLLGRRYYIGLKMSFF